MSRIADQITAVILTYNEEDNIRRTLEPLTWMKEILIVDSGSTDQTLNIVKEFPNTRVVTRAFDSFAKQCNFALTQVSTPWVLSMDADYVVSDELAKEIQAIEEDAAVAGYQASFVYRIYDKGLRGTLYPPRSVLYRKAYGEYRDYGHGHKVHIDGDVKPLSGKIFHDDRKPLARWLGSQQKYARQEADYLMSTPREELGFADKVRLTMFFAPIIVPVHVLILKGAILDGRPGWLYVLQRLLAETMIAIELLDRRLRRP